MNLPNILTVIRIILVPVFVWVYFIPSPHAIFYAMGIFLLAGLTDVADGYIARKHNQITDFGKMVDPLADKLMQCTAVICLYISALIPIWIFILFVLKELFMIFSSIFLYSKLKLVTQANWYGKLGSVLLYAAVIFTAFFKGKFPQIALWLLIAAVSWALVSLSMYVFVRRKEVNEMREEIQLKEALCETADKKSL